MGLKNIPYKKIQSLIGIHLSTKEFPKTQQLILELKNVKRRGYLKKSELVKICRWKSPRAIRRIESNTTDIIRRKSQAAFMTRSEKKKLELLTSLNGVSIPMASAILMLTNPIRYGVIDIRVWQLLYNMKTVTKNANGVGFNFNNWYQYLMILRYYAKMYEVSARDIERTLFKVHFKYQKGNLYKKSTNI